MINNRENQYQRYSSYIDTCNKYDYFVDDDINLYNLKNKLDKTSNIKNDVEYYDALIKLNKYIDNIFNTISSNMYFNKNASFYDNAKNDKYLQDINNNKRELFTDFKQSNELYNKLSGNIGNRSEHYIELNRDIEYKNSTEEKLKNNIIYYYLYTLLLLVLISIFLFIYL